MERTFAVIGHVDHGKTTLVKALTGTKTDTLKEERERGLSITLGFANRNTSAGRLHFIDTPGHADFIRMTASGLSGSDGVLLAISAVEGPSPQTFEHLRLAHSFGVTQAVVAMTKSDQGSTPQINEQVRATQTLLQQFGYESASIVPCSSTTGQGIVELTAALDDLVQQPIERPKLAGAFLPIDRVFTLPGAGTVVTGTLLGSGLQVGDAIRLEPIAETSTVRDLQISGQSVSSAAPGARVAVNLRNIDANKVKKGNVLCAAIGFQPSTRFDIALDEEEQMRTSLKHMDHLTVLFGSGNSTARIRLFSSKDEGPVRFAQLEFKSPQIAFPGQKFVLRRPEASQTVASGVVLDPEAVPNTRNKVAHVAVLKASQRGALEQIAHTLAERDRGCVDLSTFRRLSRSTTQDLSTQLSDAFDNNENTGFRLANLRALEAQVFETLSKLHSERPCRPRIPSEEFNSILRSEATSLLARAIDCLIETQHISKDGSGIALREHDPFAAMSSDQKTTFDHVEARLKDAALQPSAIFDDKSNLIERDDMIALMVWANRALILHNHALNQNLLLHTSAIEGAREILSRAYATGEYFSTSEARKTLDTNRKTIVPLLEHFDQVGVTQRDGDLRRIRSGDDQLSTCAPALRS